MGGGGSCGARVVDPLRLQGDGGPRPLLLHVDLFPRARRRALRDRDDGAGLRDRRGAARSRPRAEAAAVGGAVPRRDRVGTPRGDILMPHFALIYDVVPNFSERRTPFRDAHLRLVRDAHDRGELVLAGALAHRPDGPRLVSGGEPATVVEACARADPCGGGGLATSWRVRPWAVVVGGDAEPPKSSR